MQIDESTDPLVAGDIIIKRRFSTSGLLDDFYLLLIVEVKNKMSALTCDLAVHQFSHGTDVIKWILNDKMLLHLKFSDCDDNE